METPGDQTRPKSVPLTAARLGTVSAVLALSISSVQQVLGRKMLQKQSISLFSPFYPPQNLTKMHFPS